MLRASRRRATALIGGVAVVAVLPITLALGAAGTAIASTNSSSSAGTPIPPPPVPLAGHCATITLPVALAASDAADQTLSAQYCTPLIGTGAIDVLVPGATYNKGYWDPPVGQGGYSFVHYDLLTGHATLAIDAIGTGASSHPPSTDLTVFTAAYVLHQVIDWARRSAGYAQVNVIGHSMGSAVAAIEAGEYPSDPTRLVLTGYLNYFTPFITDGGLEADFYPAAFDPLFASSGLDEGYLTTLPGVRGQIFYYSATADPAVVSWDEAHKDLVTATEIGVIVSVGTDPVYTSTVTAPVLIIDGQQDQIFCAGNPVVNCDSLSSMRTAEQPFFPDAASLTTESVPETGHDLALSTTAPLSFAMIATWMATH